MKNYLLIILLCTANGFNTFCQTGINGAWHKQQDNKEIIIIVKPGYFTLTEFDKIRPRFYQTWGGVLIQNARNTADATIEFHSADSSQVGKKITFSLSLSDGRLISDILPGNNRWQKIDDSIAALSGVWVITGREQNGAIISITPGNRKTIKILSGTRFQWAAINTATGEFFGTGGGTYTFENGIYTERIEFFSKDSSRVGRSLNFRGYINTNSWDHSGKSSRGDPVHEIWTKLL